MKSKYAQVSFFDKVVAFGILASTPIYVGVLSMLAAFSRLIVPEKRRQTPAFIALRYMAANLSYNQFQWIAGTDSLAYDKFIRSSGLPHCVDRVGGGTAKLLWVGTKTLDKVIVYLHGGGYLFPLMEVQLAYLASLQRELASRGIQAGVAALSYTLVPEDFFPRQLRETKDAIDSLLASGVKAENIILIGDSAGANLILQALAHVLHPHPSVPPFAHGIRFGGACLVSPWVDLEGYIHPQTFADYDSVDMINAKTYRKMGELVKVGLSASDMPFMDALEAPKDWFVGVEDAVERILVTAGEYECLLDGQKEFYERLSASGHDDVLFKVHSKGTHVEVMRFDPKTGKFPVFNDKVVAWFAETFE